MNGTLSSMLSWLLWMGLFACAVQGQVQFTKGQKWQIILLGTPDMTKMPLPPTDAVVWDIDLFDNEASTIKSLKAAGKIVICYFSAGTLEDWRDDAKDFPAADVGKALPEWPDEKWIRTGSTPVRAIMAKRIKIAADKGCDAIDPDNIDGYQNDNGVNLTSTDAVDYMKWMQQEAAKYNMRIGLKNSVDILPDVTPIVDFAVNEECAKYSECTAYNAFLAAGKPVFHIEYPNPLTPAQANSTFCRGPGTDGMSTVLKDLRLDGLVIYCDGSQADTPTKGGSPRPTPSVPPPRPTVSRPTPNPPRPTTSRVITSSVRPSSTFGSSTTPRPPPPPSSTTLRPPPPPSSTTPIPPPPPSSTTPIPPPSTTLRPPPPPSSTTPIPPPPPSSTTPIPPPPPSTTSRPPPLPSTTSRPPSPPSTTSRPPSPPSTTSRPPPPPSTTPRPTSTRITSSQRPTSSAAPPPGGGGGCSQKHWDQCGGNDWKGCTTCESPYTCKGVSPPYYYQCL